MSPRTRSPIRHGTRGGYTVELSRRIPTCEACRAANTAYHNERRIRARAQKSA